MKYLKNSAEAEDMTMSIFEKLEPLLQKHEIKNFKSWLHTLTKNECLMKLRANQSYQKKENDIKDSWYTIFFRVCLQV